VQQQIPTADTVSDAENLFKERRLDPATKGSEAQKYHTKQTPKCQRLDDTEAGRHRGWTTQRLKP
jgi:hypothetical protein